VEGSPDELADDWRARYVPILMEVNSGERPWGGFDELHHATLDDLLAERDLDLEGDERHRLVQAWHLLDPWPDVREGLEALRAERVVATLSNGSVALLVDLARHGDLRFDAILSAELVRAYKPKPEVYLSAPRLLGLEPPEVMLVACHPWDLKGARKAGLRTGFVARPLEWGPEGKAHDTPDADAAAGDLVELAERLGAQ
jgi:2-haloacid dehalogenase